MDKNKVKLVRDEVVEVCKDVDFMLDPEHYHSDVPPWFNKLLKQHVAWFKRGFAAAVRAKLATLNKPATRDRT